MSSSSIIGFKVTLISAAMILLSSDKTSVAFSLSKEKEVVKLIVGTSILSISITGL